MLFSTVTMSLLVEGFVMGHQERCLSLRNQRESTAHLFITSSRSIKLCLLNPAIYQTSAGFISAFQVNYRIAHTN